jgi:hypothetical protein
MCLTTVHDAVLDLNALVGEIPESIGKLTELRHLLLKMNQLTGTIPRTMSMLTNLEVLLLEQNHFIGDTNMICEETEHNIDAFVADCGASSNDTISCSCCTTCCDRGDALCNTFTFDWRGNLDPSWMYGYRRERYIYSNDIWTP